MTREFKMDDDQYKKMLAASDPSKDFTDRQRDTLAAWRALGLEMGFDPMTAQRSRKDDRYFSARPISNG